MQDDPKPIRVVDTFGRETFISQEEWRGKVLPHNIEAAWEKPDDLYGIIIQSLEDGFPSDVVKAAEQLYAIDKDEGRAATILGIVYMKVGRLDEAEKVLCDSLAKHGEDAIVLTNLAKVYYARNDAANTEAIMWHALELDPNLDNGMAWYWAIHRDKDGDAAGFEILHKIAALPNSWRAQTWLAKHELKQGHLDAALGLYREALAHAGEPVPSALLEQMSADLGQTGHPKELLQMTGPLFLPEGHGIWAGNNLIKAHLDLGEVEAATKIVNDLYAMKRPDWEDTLRYWDGEIAKARVAKSPADPAAPMQMTVLTFDGPIWLKPGSAGAELFPRKAFGGVRIAFLGSSAEIANPSDKIEHQLADPPGRMSRAVPLFLAEQASLGSNTRARTLVPWLIHRDGQGFVFSGAAWPDDVAANYAREGEQPCDFVVVTHLKTQSSTWHVELRLVRTQDAQCSGTLAASFAPSKSETAIPDLARNLGKLLVDKAGVALSAPPPAYQVPGGGGFGDYLLRLEQLLAVRCAGTEDGVSGSLNNEREIIDGNIRLCLAAPQNPTGRLLLAKTVAGMKAARPDILPEFKEKLAALQKTYPLPDPAQSVVQAIFDEAYVA